MNNTQLTQNNQNGEIKMNDLLKDFVVLSPRKTTIQNKIKKVKPTNAMTFTKKGTVSLSKEITQQLGLTE